MIKLLQKNETGATAIEYALIAALVALGAIAGMGALGSGLDDAFSKVGTKLTTETNKATQ